MKILLLCTANSLALPLAQLSAEQLKTQLALIGTLSPTGAMIMSKSRLFVAQDKDYV